MVQRWIQFVGVVFLIVSCKNSEEKTAPTSFDIELEIVDSFLVKEKNFFLNGQLEAKMVNDTIIVVSSIKSSALAFYHINGQELGYISSKNFPEAPFTPSSFDISEFPYVYVLDRKRGRVQKFDFEKGKFIESIKLVLPEGRSPKLALSKFYRYKDGFLIELENANFDAYDPSYYQNAGNLMYFFGDDTKLITSFLEYPSEIQQFGNSLSPLNYLVSSRYKDSFLFSFPHGQVIHRLSSSLNFVSDEKYLLPLSKYFNYKIEGADQIVSMSGMMDGGDMPNIPLNHNFLTIVESDENIFIQTWMSDPEDLPQDREFYTHLLIYNKSEEVWYEMLQPRRFFDLGLLAGVAQDTLFFYEGNLRTTDEKYIKRAVLRPVEE